MPSVSIRCIISVRWTFSMDAAGPGLDPLDSADETLCSVILIASRATSVAARSRAKAGSPASSPFFPASARMRATLTSSPADEPPPRSNSSRYLATVQPSFSAPSRPALDTRTSSKKTWLTSCSPARVMIGSTLMPGRFMSSRTNVMPSCSLPSTRVRTRQNMRLAWCACVVQILVPLRM